MDKSPNNFASAARHSALRNLGCRLRNARQNTGLTQQEVATRLNVSTQTIRNWESGRYEPTRESTDALAGLYSIPFDALRPVHAQYQIPTDSPNQRIDLDPSLLVAARKDAGLSQAYTAQCAGISLAAIRRYEHRKARPTRSTLRRLALLYGKPTSWLDPYATGDAEDPEPPHMDDVLRAYLKVQPDLTTASVNAISDFILFTHQRQMSRR